MAEPTADAGEAAPPSLMSALQELLRELPGLVSDRVQLLSLELKRAGMALAQIVGLMVFAAILGVTAWLAMWAGIFIALMRVAGLHWSLGLVVVIAVNLGCAAWAVSRVRRLAKLLGLPATQRHLTFRSEPEAAPPDPSPVESTDGRQPAP